MKSSIYKNELVKTLERAEREKGRAGCEYQAWIAVS